MGKIKISAISYLNTAPFVYGLKHSKLLPFIELSFDTPAVCATRLQHKQADLGIVPVVAIPHIADANIISDYCIGADGAVRTVVIHATSPIHEINELYIDQESRTSALLAQLLIRDHWKVSPTVIPLQYSNEIDPARANTGYVLIGDKVFGYESKFPYTYDLAAEWKEFRNLPFVFATWTAVRDLSDDFIGSFNQALAYGVQHIQDAVLAHPAIVAEEVAIQYLISNISYNFDDNKQKALIEFWDLVADDVKWKYRSC